jgi:hypothetical protein
MQFSAVELLQTAAAKGFQALRTCQWAMGGDSLPSNGLAGDLPA